MLVDELVQKITIKADTKALDVVQKKEEKLKATTKELDAKTNKLGASFKSAFRWIGGTLLFKSIFDASLSMDSLVRSFDALAGSSKAGADEIAYLRQEAERLGQSFPSIANAYKGLFATGMGANMNKGTVRGVFSSLLEASAVLGLSEQETESAIIALQQMVSKGKVMSQELRLQLGNALPGAFQISAKAMGVSTAELEKMVEKGLDAKEFIKKFGDELHRQYGGDKLAKSVHSIRAEFTRLKNAIFDVRSGIFAGESGKALATAIREISKSLTSPAFKTAIRLIASSLTVILKNSKLLFAVWGGMKIMKIVQGLKLLNLSFLGLSKSVWLAIAPFLKFAMAVLMVEDIWKTWNDPSADTLTNRAMNKATTSKWGENPELERRLIEANKNSPNMKQIIESNNRLKQIPVDINLGSKSKEMAQKQSSQITQTNYISTQTVDQRYLDERIQEQVKKAFAFQGGF